MTKIEEAANIKGTIKRCESFIQKSLGNNFTDEFGWTKDSSIDKYGCKMDTYRHHDAPALYFDCYYGFYGDSNVSMLTDQFYVQCLCEAINKHMKEIREDTMQIMKEEYVKKLAEAKVEAEKIITEYNELIK
jgi:hypothetical protein